MEKSINVILDSYKRSDGSRRVLLRCCDEKYPTGILAKELVGGIIVNDKHARTKNAEISEKVSEVEKLMIRGLTFRRACELAYEGNNAMRVTEVFGEYMDMCKTEGTRGVYREALQCVVEFDENVRLVDVDKRWLMNFDRWMSGDMEGSRRRMGTNARSIKMRCMRAVFNYAIDQEYTTNYPFRRFDIKQAETAKRCLTKGEVAALRDYKCQPHQEKYRDVWMLLFYLIGINMVDLWSLTQKNIKGSYLYYERAKTHKKYQIKIEDEAMEIITRYRGKDKLICFAETVDYKTFNHQMAVELKRIGKTKVIHGARVLYPLFPKISSYWARHTWATIAAEQGVPLEDIALALGHSNGYKTTSIYVKFSHDRVDKANRKVIDAVNKVKSKSSNE